MITQREIQVLDINGIQFTNILKINGYFFCPVCFLSYTLPYTHFVHQTLVKSQ